MSDKKTAPAPAVEISAKLSTAERSPVASMAIVPKSEDATWNIAKRFAKATLIPGDLRGNEYDCFWMIMFGLELGLPPASALRSIHIIKGKPSLAADAAHGLCLRHPYCEYFRPVKDETIQGKQATFEACRRGDEPVRRTFTLDMAKKAGLIKQGGGWEKWTDQMLEARAKMWVARLVFPEKLAGVYCPEEVEHFDDDDRPQFVAPPAPRIEIPTENKQDDPDSAETLPVQDWIEVATNAAASANTKIELEALAPKFSEITKQNPELRSDLKQIYRERLAVIEKAAR